MAAPQASSRLEMLQARFQQRQLLEKEQKLLQLYDQQQLRAHQVAQRGSAGSNGSNSPGHGANNTHRQTVTRTTTNTQSSSTNSQGGGKVRQMFDERRQTTVKGIDKSYPLEPLENRSRKHQTTTTTTTVSSTSPTKNGNAAGNRQSVVTRRTVRSEANSNVNGGKPIVSYHEEVSRESSGPAGRGNELEEFGDENDHEVSRHANGNSQIDQCSEFHIEDVTNENTNQRHRTTAKIHLAAFDSNNASYRVDEDDLDNERFPEELITDAPERFPTRAAAKKPSQAEARFERFKNNSNAKRPAKPTPQVAGNTTSFTKKRTETTTHSGSSSRASTMTRTMEEETSTASPASPELVRTGRPRISSPEIADLERKFASPAGRVACATKTSGISKVSQLTHKNSMDFYPRRKSEFEKSKTFRKLQLELGESSPEPAEPEVESSDFAKSVRKRSSIVESNIRTSGRRSSSSSPTADRYPSKDRRQSREQTPDTPKSPRGSESPVYRRKSATTCDESKTTDSSMKTSNYSCRRRSSSSSQTADRDTTSGRRASREKSVERPQSRRGSASPFYRRKSTATEEEDEEEIVRSNVLTNIHLSRRRSSSASPIADREVSKYRRGSGASSPEHLPSRRGSESPGCRRKSSTTTEETTKTQNRSKTTRRETHMTKEESTRTESPTCVRLTRKRSESPRQDFRRSSTDQEESRATSSDIRRKSGGMLRSVELVKKLARAVSPEAEPTTATNRSYFERRTTLEDVEFPVHSVNRSQSKSPEHRVVKKDKAVPVVPKNETKKKQTSRKNSSEKTGRTGRDSSRSRTVSPSAQPLASTMKETESFRAKKTERRSSADVKKHEPKHQPEVRKIDEQMKLKNKINQPIEKPLKCEEVSRARSPSPEENRPSNSRRSSADTTVRRHDTFKVSRPSQRVIKIESSEIEEDLIGNKIVSDAPKDKRHIFERIEKIRTTLSKSGRPCEQSEKLESKDFERTDSVESALRRFDSIGVETEHQVTVGVDEIDISPVDVSPEVEKIGTKKSADSAKITIAVVKAQPKKIDAKTRDSSKEKLSRVNLNNKTSAKVTKEKSASVTTTTRKQLAPKSRTGQKIVQSLVRKSRLRNEEPSGRGEGKEVTDRSPSCKRRLFDDSESEIETDNCQSTVVLSTITQVTKLPEILDDFKIVEEPKKSAQRKITQTLSTTNYANLEDVRVDHSEKMIRSSSCIDDSNLTDFEQPTKALRSIEDIRKSIKRESQDFNRELKKFNTAMRREAEVTSSGFTDSATQQTSGIVSRVKITKSMKTGDEAPVVKIEKSIVKLPIAHRVAKSPSPEIGTKRSTNGRARTPTASIRQSVPSSPAKSPAAATRYGSAELRSPGSSKPLPRPSTSPSSTLREVRNRSETLQTSEYSDSTDGPGNYYQSTVSESVSTTATKAHGGNEFVEELDDDLDMRVLKDNAPSKSPVRKRSSERSSLTSHQKQQNSPSSTPLPRPASALSTASSVGSTRGQASHNSNSNKTKIMATKNKSPASTVPKGPPRESARNSTAAAVNDGLAPCKICGRRFNSDRITLHEQICSKTATKKRKQFDATTHRVKGTELEQFVKKGTAKKGQNDRKAQKPEVKSNWRRKHEDFINAIRSAKQVQAHLAAGGKLSDLPPPPASDTSDYIQCPHCSRKFNQGAAERHIPKCQNMMHNKPNPRAPPKPKR